MKRFILTVAVLGVILTCGIRIAAKQSATAQVSKEAIRQGSTLKIAVTLDRGPNTDGVVLAEVAPIDANSQPLGMGTNVRKDQTTTTLELLLPLDAKLGKWVVKKISYRPAGTLDVKELTTSGDLSFEVSAHEEIIVPSAARVTQIK
jgi:hypothetical protein